VKSVYKGLFIKVMSVGLVEVLFFKNLFILLTNERWLFKKKYVTWVCRLMFLYKFLLCLNNCTPY